MTARGKLLTGLVVITVAVTTLQAQPPTVIPPIAIPENGPSCPAVVPAPEGALSDQWLLDAGASFYLLKPYLQSNTAYRTSSGTTVTDAAANTSNATGLALSKTFDWDYQPAAAFWLGFTSPSGLGVRSRYFFFDQSSQDAAISNTAAQATGSVTTIGTTTTTVIGQVISPTPFAPTFPNAVGLGGVAAFGSPGTLLTGPGVPPIPVGQDNLVFGSYLKIDAVDVEATYAWDMDSWSFLAGFGARYLFLAQGYHGLLINNGGGTGDSERQTLDFSHTFNGGGPTISGQAAWRVAQTNLAVFASARGSLLVGDVDQVAAFTQSVNDPAGLITGKPGAFTVNSRIPNTSDNVITSAEFELGLEYGFTLLNNNCFARCSVVDQTYFGAGNASRTDGNLSLFGCSFSLGMNF